MVRFERERVGGSFSGDDSDDLGIKMQPIANGRTRANAGSLANRHIHDVKVGYGGEEFQPICRDALDDVWMVRRDEVPAVIAGERLRVFFGCLEVVTKLDEIGSLGP